MKQRHGQWLINPDGYYPYCSVCKCEPEKGHMTRYCPDCGASMDVRPETMRQFVVLERPALDRLDEHLLSAMQYISALPESYYKDLVMSRLVKIKEILEANK